MRVSALLCASVAAFAAWSASEGAHAAMPSPSAASQSAPSSYRLSPGDAAAEKACVDKGGAVSTNQDGYRICTTGRACPAPGGPTRTAKLDASDPAAAQKCKDACGAVSTDASGAKVCTRPEG